jgi:hypothetical protein
MQFVTTRKIKLTSKSWIDGSLLQHVNLKVVSRERPPRLGGRLLKLLPPRSKDRREHKLPISVGIAPSGKLHSWRHNSVSEFKPCSLAGNRFMDGI